MAKKTAKPVRVFGVELFFADGTPVTPDMFENEAELRGECLSDWAVAVAKKIQLPVKHLETEGFVRKTFDLYLMLEGGFSGTADPIPSPKD